MDTSMTHLDAMILNGYRGEKSRFIDGHGNSLGYESEGVSKATREHDRLSAFSHHPFEGSQVTLAIGRIEGVHHPDNKGTRGNLPHPRAGQMGWCNGCDGRGVRENPNSWHHFPDADHFEQSVVFLENCGGVEIN